MKKRKILTLITALSVVAILGVGSTMAYLTDEDNTFNQFQTNRVDISITDQGNNQGLIVPGDEVKFAPEVKVEDESANAVVRVKVKFKVTKTAESSETNLQGCIFELQKIILGKYKNTYGVWIRDGWSISAASQNFEGGQQNGRETYASYEFTAYYGRKAAPAEFKAGTSSKLFVDRLVMPAELGNKWANCKVDVSYKAEAVQYDHFTSWDDVDNNKITVESYEY